MNFLAHLYIAERRGFDAAGAVLGDAVRGRDLEFLPPAVAHSVRLHRRVDAVCDAHPVTRNALAAMPTHQRRYGGIILDLCADHLLARHWEMWRPEEPLATFCQRMAQAVAGNRAAFLAAGLAAPAASRFQAVLEGVANTEGIDRALAHIAGRARHPQALLDATANWQTALPLLDAGMPELLESCCHA